MNRKHHLANAILWAAAIVASALLGAPAILSTTVLPALYVGSLLVAEGSGCEPRKQSA